MAKEILTGSKASTIVKSINGRAVLDGASIHGLSASGNTITYTKGDGSTDTITVDTSSHNQASNTINAMTGYSKASTAAAISATDSLNTAIGKLEKALDGKQASGTYLTPTSNVSEAYLAWGGKNFSGSYGCIDAAMVGNLGANRFAFGKPAGITIEYSRDGGSTWTDYAAGDTAKKRLVAQGGAGLVVGKSTNVDGNRATANCRLRITVDTDAFGLYTVLNKFVIYISSNGSQGCWCSIDASLENTPTTWVNFANQVPVSGWSGYNVINTSGITTYGNTPASQYGLIRFTFGCTGHSGNYAGLTIAQLMAFGGVGWSTPSTMASTGTLYSFDESQNAIFPAQVTATQFNGSLNGVATSALNVKDYNNTDNTISIGYAGAGVAAADASQVCVYTDSGKKIKDMSWDNLKTKLGLGSAAYTASTSYAAASHTHSNYLTGITKAQVTTALGYTPPTTDTNTTYSAAANGGLTLSGTAFSADGSKIINNLSEGTANPTDADYYVTQYAGGGTTTTSYHRRPHSALYNYMKGKMDSVYAAKSHTHSEYVSTKLKKW